MQTVTLSEFCRIVKKGLERGQKGVEPCAYGRKPRNVYRNWSQHGRTLRYRGSGMYEKCGSELERPYPSPKGKEKVYKHSEIIFLVGGSRRGT